MEMSQRCGRQKMTDKKSEILVGVDGSESSLRAAEWAAVDAAAVGLTVTVCYVSDVSALADVPLPQDVRRAARAYGHRMVDRALVRIRHAAPVDAAGEVVDGNPAAELIRQRRLAFSELHRPTAVRGGVSTSQANRVQGPRAKRLGTLSDRARTP
jgi:hypothetical protein